ncbi:MULTISPECIES: hypothetical protein [unclassified Streptomyces]|uniref:GNAT family N-acetyltransferase n=1 Tax=unclassified Streptomyces TaxID=2593676 RepID=UPI0006F66A09|nr:MULTISPECIES: hypothetical protein [unclassified Streptomyces]KQX54974.1 hypothetical protein ASD33_32060 [Streptomyces sp. Root1304]KRA94492.1 hypothetical protein ASE09_31845 [Streptomyces sp. Root66D1]
MTFALSVHRTTTTDPLARPLLDELAHEYTTRYGSALARRVLTVLEREAAARGYSRLCLTTGPRQPEAKGLYLASGYRPLFDVSADPESIGPLPFEKFLETPRP